jgi:hypothetical protein
MNKFHSRVIYWGKFFLFTMFIGNLLRVCIRTWKYGGAKTNVQVSYDGDDDLNPADGDIMGV